MGSIVHLPLSNRVKIREDVHSRLIILNVQEQVSILKEIEALSRMGLVVLRKIMSISLNVMACKIAVLYGVILTSHRAYVVKCRKNTLIVCGILDIDDELKHYRNSNEILIDETVANGSNTCQVSVLLTPVHSLLVLGRVRVPGAVDQLFGEELKLAA